MRSLSVSGGTILGRDDGCGGHAIRSILEDLARKRGGGTAGSGGSQGSTVAWEARGGGGLEERLWA
ncbi:MAG: hypothetical protein AAF581_23905, partial [Planctomycetota bacterium]